MTGKCAFESIPLPAEFFPSEAGSPRANGIAAYNGGLIINNTGIGGMYFVDPNDNFSVTQFIPEEDSVFSDGILIRGDTLYSTKNFANQIGVFKLSFDDCNISGQRVGAITSPDYDTPTTVAIYDGYLYTPQGRFATIGLPTDGETDLKTFSETFTLVAVASSDDTE